MKRTPLYDTHVASGAKMAPFAGWEMPVSYTGTVAEVAAVRTASGIFDVSHMGEIAVLGPQAFDFVQHLTTNDAGKLGDGNAQYSLLLNETGGVIDDIIIYRQHAEEYLIVVNAGCRDKDFTWIQNRAAGYPGAMVSDESDETALIAVQGPTACATVCALIGDSGQASALPRFHFLDTAWRGAPMRISRTGYTGEDGFEVFCPANKAPSLWGALEAAGCTPSGLGARDVLRLEAAYPLYGHELDDTASPLESGVAWAVKTSKGEFVGRDALLALRKRGVGKSLVCLQMSARAIPREQYPVYSGDAIVGAVTSGTYSPTVKQGIAMARIDSVSAVVGMELAVDIRGRKMNANVVAAPFYRNGA